MCGFRLGLVGIIAILGLVVAVPAGAQENLDLNKTPAQMFASDCVICHKSPQGLAKAGGILGLESFLRQHYTASRESAAAIAAYLQSMDRGPAAPATGRAIKRTPKGDDKAKATEKKPAAAKPEGKPGDRLPGDNKPADAKAAEPKASEPKASDAKPSEAKPNEPKPSEAKPSEPKPAEGGKSD